jgi:hypothetical protein
MTSIAVDNDAFHALVEHALDGVLIGAADGRIFFANRGRAKCSERLNRNCAGWGGRVLATLTILCGRPFWPNGDATVR